MSNIIFDFLKSLNAEEKAYRALGGEQELYGMQAEYAFNGDPSFMKSTARRVLAAMVRGEEMTPVDRLWLLQMVAKVTVSNKAARELSGSAQNKGAVKNGFKGMKIASMVWEAVDNGATSIEDAWEQVAEAAHIGPSMVKAHWTKWKPVIKQQLALSGGDMDQELKSALERNKGN